jgi:hypothetical protein
VASDILNSWKEIANYMGRGVRTVQRWEQQLGLPVRRPWGKSRSCVMAVTSEIDSWVRTTRVNRSNGANGNDGLTHDALRDKLRTLIEEYRAAGISLRDDLQQLDGRGTVQPPHGVPTRSGATLRQPATNKVA